LNNVFREVVDEFRESIHRWIKHDLVKSGLFQCAQPIDHVFTLADEGGRADGFGSDEALLAFGHEGAMAVVRFELMFLRRSPQLRQVIRVGVVDFACVGGQRARFRLAGRNRMEAGDDPWPDHLADARRVDCLAGPGPSLGSAKRTAGGAS